MKETEEKKRDTSGHWTEWYLLHRQSPETDSNFPLPPTRRTRTPTNKSFYLLSATAAVCLPDDFKSSSTSPVIRKWLKAIFTTGRKNTGDNPHAFSPFFFFSNSTFFLCLFYFKFDYSGLTYTGNGDDHRSRPNRAGKKVNNSIPFNRRLLTMTSLRS